MLSTHLAPDTALAVVKRQNLAASISVSELPDTESNKTDEDLADNLSRNISQIHPIGTVNESRPELESRTESISPHNDEVEGSARTTPTTAEGMEHFKFDLEGFFPESFSSMINTHGRDNDLLSINRRSRIDSTGIIRGVY